MNEYKIYQLSYLFACMTNLVGPIKSVEIVASYCSSLMISKPYYQQKIN